MTFTAKQVRDVVRRELRALADEIEADFATRDTNDGSTYCIQCGGPQKRGRWVHDPECLVVMIRERKPSSPVRGTPGDEKR